MNKRPSSQFYPGDWWRAVDLRKCCMSTQGCWFNMLMIMWDEEEQGKIVGTTEEICRIVGCSPDELNMFIKDNYKHNFADVTNCNGDVTIINRRLYRAFLERKATKDRVAKHRSKECNANVTSLSSSSTSSSTTKHIKYNTIFESARKLYPGTKRGYEVEFENFKKKNKNWSEIVVLLEPAIQRQIDWRRTTKCFIPAWKHLQTWINQKMWTWEPPEEPKDDFAERVARATKERNNGR